MFNLQLRLGQRNALHRRAGKSGSRYAAFHGCYKILFVAKSAMLHGNCMIKEHIFEAEKKKQGKHTSFSNASFSFSLPFFFFFFLNLTFPDSKTCQNPGL